MTKRKPTPFSLRLSTEEREYLDTQSGDTPLGEYIRSKILDNPLPRRRQKKRKKQPIKDHQILAQIFALLNATHIPSNLNQIAKAINNNALILTPETESAVREACEAVISIRDNISKALGRQTKGET